MQPTLVLFDIDGTLLITQGATSRSILLACRQLFGQSFAWHEITVGTLDQQIFSDLCRANGIHDPAEHLEAYKAVYLEVLRAELDRVRGDIVVLPGVRDLLRELDEASGVSLGIVSGNFRQAIHAKLDHADLDRSLFTITACAEDGESRLDLPRLAMRRHAEQVGAAVPAERVFVIGDTPRDIECARACGAQAIAVATGRYGLDQLGDADLSLESLSDPAALLSRIFAAG